MGKKGVLLVNLGSPDSTEVSDVRRYLKEFLSDRRVFDAPSPVREYVLYGKVLPFRPAKTAAAYKRIWTDEGAPLMVISRSLLERVRERTALPVELGMRYRNPSIRSALENLAAQGVEELLLIPLYPHYASSSYESVVVKAWEDRAAVAPGMKMEILPPFYAEPDYIDALVENSREPLDRGYDRLIFSFHGIPERHLRKADSSKSHCTIVPDCCETCSPAHATCYRAQCLRTVREFVARAKVPAGRFSVSFQSRFGREPWLKPYTDLELERIGREGKIRKLLVICPAFVSDCLETLEEIAMEGKKIFLDAGGKEFAQIPCLNTHPSWIDFLHRRIERFETGRPPRFAQTLAGK